VKEEPSGGEPIRPTAQRKPQSKSKENLLLSWDVAEREELEQYFLQSHLNTPFNFDGRSPLFDPILVKDYVKF
jgi:hypothetical protein